MSRPDGAGSRPAPLRRAADGAMVGGVAAGIARRFEVEPLIPRVAFIAAALIGGAGVVLYLAALLVIPRESDGRAALRVPRAAGLGAALLLAVFAVVGSGLISAVDLLGTGRVGVAAYLVALGLAALWWRDNAPADDGAPAAAHENPYPPRAPTPSTPRARGRSWTLPAVAVALILVGGLALLDAVSGVSWIAPSAYPALALAVVGVAVILSAFSGRSGALIPIGIVLALGVTAVGAVGDTFEGGFGEREWTPRTAAEIPEGYRLGAGEATLDLRRTAFPAGETDVRVSLGAGELEVRLPDGPAVEWSARVGAGEIQLLGDDGVSQEGVGSEMSGTISPADTGMPRSESRTVTLDIDVSFGSLRILEPGGRP